MQARKQSLEGSPEQTGDVAAELPLKKDRVKQDLKGKEYEQQLGALEPEQTGREQGAAGGKEELPSGELPPPEKLSPPKPPMALPAVPEFVPAAQLPELEGVVPPPRRETSPGGEESAKAAPKEASKPAQAESEEVKPEEATGLATSVSRGRFVSAARQVEAKWRELSKVERAEGLGDAAADELEAAGVPGTGTVIKDLGPSTGELAFAPWNVELNERKFDKASVTTDEMAELADVTFHEARHGEQWHRMARIQAGKGLNASQIHSKMGLKAEVAADAARNPLGGDSLEAQEGEAWFESVMGTGGTYRGLVYDELDRSMAEYDQKGQTCVAAHQNNQEAAAAANRANESLAAAQAAYGPLYTRHQTLLAQPVADPALVQKALEEATTVWEEIQRQTRARDAAYAHWTATANALSAAQTELNTAHATMMAAYQAYKNLPEEADAWAVGGQVRAAYTG